MKKLALALACLVSVAFFASCQQPVQNPEPTIAVLVEEGYVKNGDVVDVNDTIDFGFVMAANTQTNKELASIIVKIDDNDSDTTIINGKEYTYKGAFVYHLEAKNEIIDEVVITAIVTDVAGETATTSIKLSINQPEDPLVEVDFEWYRLGNTQTGLEEYGLFWEQNAKSPFAQIKPLEGVILYKFDSSVWDEVTYETQKAAKFADGATTAAVYNKVDVNLANGTYDDVIGTRMADGTLHLIHVTSHRVGAQQNAGRPIYINGQAK